MLPSLSEADLVSVLSGHSLGNRKRVWNLIQEAQSRAASATGRRKRMQAIEAAAAAAAAANGLSSSEVDSSSDEEPSLKNKNRDLWLLHYEMDYNPLTFITMGPPQLIMFSKRPCKISAVSTTNSGGSDEVASGNELKRRKMSNKVGPGGDAASATVTTNVGSSIGEERKTSSATLPGSTSVCFSCLNRQMRNFSQNLRPERWKTLLAFLYVLLVSWITAFVMVIVHDRVPDMERYPPLPDLLLGEIEKEREGEIF